MTAPPEPELDEEERRQFDRGVDEFNRGFYFECHDTIEDLWSGLRGPSRDFFQGLIQVSVAFYHLGNGNLAGADSMARRALKRFERYPDRYFGFDLAAQREALVRPAGAGGPRRRHGGAGEAPMDLRAIASEDRSRAEVHRRVGLRPSRRAIKVEGPSGRSRRMEYRQLGRTSLTVSTVSFGAWAIGGAWGQVDDSGVDGGAARGVDAGVNFIDTADVYGDGRSERLVARLRRERAGRAHLRGHQGRAPAAHADARGLHAREPDRLGRSQPAEPGDGQLDLLQLHCPHPAVYDSPEVFEILDDLVRAGKIRYYGVSVETVDEALRAIRNPGVQTVQIIFNMFRLKPADRFFAAARERKVGDPGPRAAGQRPAHGQAQAPIHFRRRRPSPVQSQRRAVRQGRDVLRRALRGRPAGGRGAAPARARGRDPRASSRCAGSSCSRR